MKCLFCFIGVFIFFGDYGIKVQAQSFSWAQAFTASNNGSAGVSGIVFDAANNSYNMGGFSRIVDFDASSNTYNMGSSSNTNSRYVLKEDAAGNFLWAKQFPSLSVSTTTSWSINNPRIVLDAAKNIYIFDVHIDSVDADPGPITYPLPFNGTIRSCIIKLDSTGSFIWAKEIYGSGTTTGTYAIISGAKIDTITNNIYLVMSVGGTVDVDPGLGVYNIVTPPNSVNPLNNNANVVIEKLDTAGNFIWAKQITGTKHQNAAQLVLDSLHNVYIAGTFNDSADFDPGQGVAIFVETSTDVLNSGDIFVAKYDSAGNYIWARQIGGTSEDVALDLAIDLWSNIAITGHFGGTVDFDPGAGTHLLTSNSTRSIFTLKLRNNGDFAWAEKAGYGAGLYEGRGIATDTAGQVYVVSNTYPLQKFDSTGQLLWELETAGTAGWICLDNENSIYLSGSFSGTQDFDPGPGVYNLTGSNSGFILKLHYDSTFTSIHNPETSGAALKVYPNPGNGIFKFTSSSRMEQLIITDMTGKAIYHAQPNKNEYITDLSGHAAGIYFYQIITNKGKESGKLILGNKE